MRHRHNSLIRWREKYPNAPLTDAPSRCYNPQSYKDFQEQWDKAKAILNCNTLDDMVKAKVLNFFQNPILVKSVFLSLTCVSSLIFQNNLVSSLLKRKKKVIPVCTKKKKMSVIEADLVNYFRCSYDVPGVSRKSPLKPDEVDIYADELAMIFSLLKANLNLPSLEELDEDATLSPIHR